MIIRTAVEADERPLAVIDHTTWSPGNAPVPQWPLDTPFFDQNTLVENVLVAEEGGQLLGYVKLRPDPIPSSGGHVQQVNGFAVAPEHQGKGIGRLLMEAAREEAIRRGARRVVLRALSTNGPALALYRSLGYETEGVLKGQFLVQGRYVDDVFMALNLITICVD